MRLTTLRMRGGQEHVSVVDGGDAVLEEREANLAFLAGHRGVLRRR